MTDQVICINTCNYCGGTRGCTCAGARAALAVRSGYGLSAKYDGDSIFYKDQKTSADCNRFQLSGANCPTDLPEINVMALPVAP